MQKKFIVIILAIVAIYGCTKKTTTPNTNTNTTTTVNNDTTIVQKLKWNKVDYLVQYKADGVTENFRAEYKYDNEGRPIEYKAYYSGVLYAVQRDYVYTGNEAIYYTDNYTNGTLTSTVKAKIAYNNN
jgi:hypothetical protein